MSIQNLLILLLFPLLLSANKESQNPKEFTVIEGLVYCQSCENSGSWSLADAKPIALAKVGIVCKDYKKRVWFYKSFKTDKNGYYYAPIEGIEGTEGFKKRNINGCRVHLLSSPDIKCNLLTNVNLGIVGGRIGEGKKVEKKKGYEVLVYGALPLAFRQGICAPDDHLLG